MLRMITATADKGNEGFQERLAQFWQVMRAPQSSLRSEFKIADLRFAIWNPEGPVHGFQTRTPPAVSLRLSTCGVSLSKSLQCLARNGVLNSGNYIFRKRAGVDLHHRTR